ncbi:uncharacterized protein RCO7_00680 [Rhynchosporium graminicola]|uniref:Rho-GAP domain-containing protein n=1 Tax=Rhynchosporium graminicola TaxID=2792576 RepID=A0A1E1LUX1_9HELO|nr:uncharacterized protein RCO7_00680 [Rhynchosporium commune]
MAQQPTIFDDMNIAVGLLSEPKDPRHRASFTGVSFIGHDGSEPPPQQIDPQPGGNQEGRLRRAVHTSNTWTSSSGDVLSDHDDIDDRTFFVQEYNRLARKHGVRQVDTDELGTFNDDLINISAKSGNWFSRNILRKTSSSQSVKLKSERHLKHRRSISDLSIRLKGKRDKLKDKDLQDLVRLCGSSLLYLPTEYAAGSLAVPTCFRATAQHLVQHAPSTRGIFRVPGSQAAVAALYNHYGNMDEEGQVISGTVRCPTLPDHIRCDVHDVASAFKKFISGLPGGILGSLHLFNVLVSIQTQLRGDPEVTRTKQSKVRARLISLAIATPRSQFRRELICAVFGLLSMIGRAAEIAPREDERGRPLPTSDLMGYGPLGVVFGPLLLGDLLDDYTMRIANPQGGLVLLPISPPKSRRDRHKKSKTGDEGTAFNTHIDKIKVANSITEMLITHWRDVVRHMRNLSALKTVASTKSVAVRVPRQPILRPSASESFALRKPPDWDQFRSPLRRLDRSISPTPAQRTHDHTHIEAEDSASRHGGMLVVKKQRSKSKPLSSQRLSGGRSLSILSPTAEERFTEELEESSAAISPPCEDPLCTSASLSRAANPLKAGFHSPSSSSEDVTFPHGMMPLPDHREEPTSPESLDIENHNPRPALAETEISKILNPFEHDSKQPLHFMSTPTFSKASPSKSLRKKVRHSKESSSSTGKSKNIRTHGSPSKLQKKSSASVERGKSKDLRRFEHSGDHPMMERLEPRDFNAELGQFAAEWSALDLRRKVLLTAKSKKDMQNFKAILDTEQALLEARYSSILADRAVFEKKIPHVVEPRSQAMKAENTEDENMPSSFRPGRGCGDGVALKSGPESLEHALEAIDRQRKILHISRLDLESDWETFANKWEQTNGQTEGGIAIMDAAHAALRNRDTNLEAVEDEIVVKVDIKQPQNLPSQGQQTNQYRAQGASHIAEQKIRVDENERKPALQSHTFDAELHEEELPLNRSVPKPLFDIMTDNSKTVRPELTIFISDVAVWKSKWKSYNQGKQTISSSEKKVHDDEKAALDTRWNEMKARIDAQSDAGEPKGPSKSSSLPFEHLSEKPKQILSVLLPLKPGIKLSRASSRGSEENNARSPRRVGGSDPGLQPRARSYSPRRVSKSLYEDPKREKKVFDLSKISRDPLLRISREEDDASLAILAQALDEPIQQQDSDVGNGALNNILRPNASRNDTSHDNSNQLAQPVSQKENSSRINHLYQDQQINKIGNKAGAFCANSRSPKHLKSMESGKVTERIAERPPEVQIIQGQKAMSSDSKISASISRRLKPTEPPSEVTISVLPMQVPAQKVAQATRGSIAPSVPTNETGTVYNTGCKAAGSPNKISALVAHFNQAKQQSTSVSPPRMFPDRSPAKTLTRTLPDSHSNLGSKVVSPYTTNPSSPTKSQKSEKTPQSARTTGGEVRSLLDPKSSPVRRQSPKRVLRDSLYDSSPLRPGSQDSDSKSSRFLSSPTKNSNIHAVSLRSVQKTADGSPSRITSRPTDAAHDTREVDKKEVPKSSMSKEKGELIAIPPLRFSLDSFTQAETHIKESSTSSSETMLSIHEPAKGLTSGATKVYLEPIRVHCSPPGGPRVLQAPEDSPAFDGPPGAANIGRVLPRPDPMPVAHHLYLSRPPAASPANSSDPAETESGPAIENASHLPGRNNSILYKQVLNLQRQLFEKTEEVQHLKQFLNARDNLDVGTLSEELRQTKRDLEIWKKRAEAAEKQLEITAKLPSRKNSFKHTNSTSSRGADHQHRSSTDSRQEEGTMAERIRKALHGQLGIDGADSPRRFSSEESTETVVRDYRDVVSRVEYSIWQEHTTNGNGRGESE